MLNPNFNYKNIDPEECTFGKISSPGTKFVQRIKIKLSEIYVAPIKSDNSVRSKGKNVMHIQRLEQSFKQGIDYSQMPPTVRIKSRNENGEITKYELVTGNHRFEALRNLGFDEWIFDVYEIPFGSSYGYEDAIRTFQLKENNFAPNLASTEDDVVNVIVRLIEHKSKLVIAEEQSIADYVNEVCTYMHGQTKSKILRDVIRKLKNTGCAVAQDVVTYTATDVNDFISKTTKYVVSGNYDHNLEMNGWSVLEGYEYEMLMNAIKKFGESGNESYFTLHTKSPTEKYGVNERREKMVQTFESLESSLLKVFAFYEKNGKFPWRIEGFLPQDVKNGESEYIPF